MPRKTWNVGDVLTAADMNTYVRDQSIITCTAATRPTGLTASDKAFIYETDTGRFYVWDGTALAWNMVSQANGLENLYTNANWGSSGTVISSGTTSATWKTQAITPHSRGHIHVTSLVTVSVATASTIWTLRLRYDGVNIADYLMNMSVGQQVITVTPNPYFVTGSGDIELVAIWGSGGTVTLNQSVITVTQ